MKASSTMLTLVVVALLLSSLHVASAALSAVSVFATVPLNPELRFTRVAPLAFNASLCSSPPDPSTPIISVRPSARLQPWTGAGAALTEATAYNFLRLKERNITAYHRLLHLLFASPMRGGIGLDLLRFPITASDMSLPTPGGGWSFDDYDGDVNLTHFNTKRASEYQIPALLDILQVARREGNARLKLFAAPWSIPAWMKDTKLWTNGTLREDLYEVYARYLARVVQTFHDLDAPFWAITLQNEPQIQNLNYPTSILSPVNETNLARLLHHNLRAVNLSTAIIGWDFNWDRRDYPVELIDLPDGQRYIDYVSFHCYSGDPSTQSYFHSRHPDKPILFTECTQGGNEWSEQDFLVHFIGNRWLYFDQLSNWGQSVVHWNLAVDLRQGPHSGGCGDCSGTVTVDVAADNYTVVLNGQLYNIAHFTALLPVNSTRLNTSTEQTDQAQLSHLAFIRGGDDGRLVQIMNEAETAQTVVVKEEGVKGACVQVTVEGQSMLSLLWRDTAEQQDDSEHRHTRTDLAPQEGQWVAGMDQGLFW